MVVDRKFKSQITEDIISEATEKMSGFGALTAEAAVLAVSRRFEKQGRIKSSEWSAYQRKATETLLSRLKKNTEEAEEARGIERLDGAEQAELAYKAVREAEEKTDELAQLREDYKNANK